MDLTLVVPCFNEEESIESTVQSLKAAYPNVPIIVVNDGSTDQSAQKIASISGIQVITHETNRGYGASLKSAIQKATTPYICFFDADGQHDPKDIAKLYAETKNGHMMVVGARDKNFLRDYKRVFGKKILIGFANFLMRKKIKDLNSGLRIVHQKILNECFNLLPDGFSASTTTTVYAICHHYSVHYVPIHIRPRIGKSSVRQFADGFRVLLLLIRLSVMFKPLQFFLPLSFFFILSGTLYGLWKSLLVHQGIPVGGGLLIILGFHCFFFGLLADGMKYSRSK
ncbi:MAG: hypothetical protein A3B70_01720 [Deltaproteobacteria bacterium RIFCSPHIGHO2_02_FULL_40_11]|nr:MAG: hypothetical protein A3B70_01720 [Deltaproteobacteria bacterium RIFCSPHIGHO2_02_FULL_40_11]